MRYDYASFTTYAAADKALEHMFASGEVSEGEAPMIERRAGRFYITMRGC